MRILITGAGGAAAVSVWKDLHKQHELYMGDIDPCAAGLYLVPESQRLMLPRGDDSHYAREILTLAIAKKIDIIIPTVDIELIPLAQLRTLFRQKNIKLALAPLSALEICRDKYKLLEVCKNVIPIPDFFILNHDTISTVANFPCFAKPRIGAGSAGATVIHNANELISLPLNDSYLIQEWLPGKEYSVDMYMTETQEVLAAVPRFRMKIDSGVAVAAQSLHIPQLEQLAIKTVREVNVTYASNIQFKMARDGQYKLLEINPRFPGSLPLTTQAGINLPDLLLQELTGRTLPEERLPFKELMVVRYWTEQFCTLDEWEMLCQQQVYG